MALGRVFVQYLSKQIENKEKPQNEDVCDTDTKPMWEASLQGNTISFK